jgi:hypothetical protein
LGKLESLISNPADTYYNLLVQGFREGHLSVKKDVPAGFARLADPYDPAANRLYRDLPCGMSDLSYYKSRLYLYFGVTPALILFWPFVALTGHNLVNRLAVTIFCGVGFLASAGLLCAVWRRCFSEVSVWVVSACALALGLATGVPVLLPPSDIYQVAISCGYMLTMLALGAVWCALHDRERTCRWLMAASVAYGLAVGARPSLLFGGIILLVPVIRAWRERRPIGAVLMAATIPITLIGLGLMLYNALRFDNPFEFGLRYELAGTREVTQQFFSVRYMWFNFQSYFLQPVRWSSHFPFVNDAVAPPVPAGHGVPEAPFGILPNVPLVWLALGVPLAWRDRSGPARSTLCWFLLVVVLLFGICALTMELYFVACCRYETEFLPALVLLAIVGVFGLERTLARQPVRRRLARWGWGLLLGFSVVFNVLVSVKNYAYAGCSVATMLAVNGRVPEAIREYEYALRLNRDLAEGHYAMGIVLWQTGKIEEAIAHFERAIRIQPDFAHAHNNLGVALRRMGKVDEAIGQYEQAVRLKPDFAEAHYNLGLALAQAGKIEEAIAHFEQALRIKPDFTQARTALARLQARQ